MKKPDPNEGNIKWSGDKKRERDLEREQKRAKQIIGAKYNDWKIELCSKPRTRKEVIAFLYRLRDMVLDHAKDCATLKLKDFSDFTYAIIERHLAELITAHIAGHNVAKQHVPVSLVASGQVAIAKTEAFRNAEELYKIDFVKWFSEQPGFKGFSWTKVEKPMDIEFMLLAHYESGDSWLVGMLINDVGLDGIPCYDDQAEIIIDDFVKLRETGSTAQAGEAPSPTPPAAAGTGEPSAPTSDAGPANPAES